VAGYVSLLIILTAGYFAETPGLARPNLLVSVKISFEHFHRRGIEAVAISPGPCRYTIISWALSEASWLWSCVLCTHDSKGD
jgi:hypothetical protein